MTLSIVVSDTSPIRALAHLDLLDVLHRFFGQVLIPPAVLFELEYPQSRHVPLAIRGLSFIRIQSPQDRAAVQELRAILGAGEAEALVLAGEVHAEAVLIDEAAGRDAARQRGLTPLGVLGILGRAKQRGLVAAVAPLLDRLQGELGFFISDALRHETLRQAGEQDAGR